MNSIPSSIGQDLDANDDFREGKVYEYKLSLLSNLLNPPEVLLCRCLCALALLISIGTILYEPAFPGGWLMLLVSLSASWWFIFRHGLPLYSKGKFVTLVITEQLVALETNGKFFHVPINQVIVRKGLAGTHIILRPHGDYLLVSKDALSFEQLNAEINTKKKGATK